MKGRTTFRIVTCALTSLLSLALPLTSAAGAEAPPHLEKLAQQQTNLLLTYYEGQNVSPPSCEQPSRRHRDKTVLLLPVVSFAPGDQTIRCKTKARSVLVDLGGYPITEDLRFPTSSYPLDGQDVPFTRQNLEPICDDLIAQDLVGAAVPATVDGNRSITGKPFDSGVFTARVNRLALEPDGTDLYADSVALGHPGRLATVFCGSKAKVALRPGTHIIVVDYSERFGGVSTVFTYLVTIRR